MGLSGPVSCPRTHAPSVASPVLTGTTTLDGVDLVPTPPAELYEDFLQCSGCLPTVSASSGPQPSAVVMPTDLITLTSAFPRPFPTFQGPGQAPRAPVPTPGPRKILPDRCYVPPPDSWSWPSRGSVVPAFNPPLMAPVPPPTSAGASTTFPGSVANPPGPLPAQLTPGPTVKNTLSYLPALGPFFQPVPRPLSLAPSAGPTHLLLLHGLPSGPQVLHTPVSAVAALVPSATSSQPTSYPPRFLQCRRWHCPTFSPGCRTCRTLSLTP